MNGVSFERTGVVALPWIFYDTDGEFLVLPMGVTVRAFSAVAGADHAKLLDASPDELSAVLDVVSADWVPDNDRTFNAWYAAVFAGMVLGCDTLRLGARLAPLQIMDLSKLSEIERSQQLDRDADCSGNITDHVLIVLPPLDPDSTDPEERYHRLYHINLLTVAMVPPRPALLGKG